MRRRFNPDWPRPPGSQRHPEKKSLSRNLKKTKPVHMLRKN
jgi:hypothetical protein